jgi:hypothetical protein
MSPKQESERLMNDILPLAQRMLREYGEFYPYGGYIKPDGEIVHVGAKHLETDHPKSNDLIHILRSSFQDMARANECKAVAIICDVRVTAPGSDQKTDAIQVILDHVDDYSVRIFFPYQIAKQEVVYGKTFAWQGKREIFGGP